MSTEAFCVNTDTLALMRQLARMANMDHAGVRKMVLVLSVDDLPRLFVESFLDRDRCAEEMEKGLHKVDLEVKSGPAPDVKVEDQPLIVEPRGGLPALTADEAMICQDFADPRADSPPVLRCLQCGKPNPTWTRYSQLFCDQNCADGWLIEVSKEDQEGKAD